MWKVFQPQLYNYHVPGNKILTSMIFFATESLKQQNSSKWITSYCYYQLHCFGLLIIKFFLISTPCNSKFLQIELYRDIIIVLIHFGVHGLWFKSKRLYTREAEPFCLGSVSGISIAYSRLCNEQGMGRIIRTVTVHQVKWGTLASPTWQGETWGHAGTRGRWVQSQHQSRARASTHGCEHSRLAPLSAAGRSTAQLQKVFYRKIMLSSNPPKSVFTFAPLQPLDTG